MRLWDRAFGSLHGIRILELNGDLSAAIGKTYLLHHEVQIRFGFGYREVPALFTSWDVHPRNPTALTLLPARMASSTSGSVRASFNS
jgi:hypothetical protein